jgi:predicted SnoaL-like aldol condensation-catalyzing enzyme
MRATAKGLLEQFPDMHVEVKRAFAEGDMVVVHSEMTGVSWGGPSDASAGDGYPSYAVIDIARVEDGRIAEHWDVIQEVPQTSVSGNSMF